MSKRLKPSYVCLPVGLLPQRHQIRSSVALMELREQWKAEHTKGCQCRPCESLRLECLRAGDWKELYDDLPGFSAGDDSCYQQLEQDSGVYDDRFTFILVDEEEFLDDHRADDDALLGAPDMEIPEPKDQQ